MKQTFHPETYRIEDRPGEAFIDRTEILELLEAGKNTPLAEVERIIARSFAKQRLSLADTAALIGAQSPEAVRLIKEGAARLKSEIYGNRIVLFAPLYVGNRCTNACTYCGFNRENGSLVRKTLSPEELAAETEALEDAGHKRLILVYGEHPHYDARFIADTVRQVYKVKKGNGEIRRVNINAAPLDVEGFRTVKEAGIGTYQIFQETYDPELYPLYHPSGRKSDYAYRLTALDRAMEAGIDDVGIGALLGLGDWRFEVMALVRHANHLESCFGVGPHTISFPRIKEAMGVNRDRFRPVNDDDFARLIAILRLAVPYTGLILTARENAALRKKLIRYGISQIDGGTDINVGGYSAHTTDSDQFAINDGRTLAEVIGGLTEAGYLPSFCTACYRKGRTGEHFMEFSVPGFIKRFCTPNALFTFAEYLEDYADESTREKGYALIERELAGLDHCMGDECRARVERIRNGERDLLF